MASKQKQEAQNPLILRSHRLMEAFAKSNEERDFYLDRSEGFIIYVDLDKTDEELNNLEKELNADADRYCPIPKLSFYETKKIMEGFVNEKVYDIDTKEKLLDIIQSKEARENFLEFIYDHHAEYDKWQQYYQERSRIRIIEWLRNNHFHFVFEEDLDLPKSTIEKLKLHLFDPKVGKDILAARKNLTSKAKTYYSTEALNPRPKRGRPPKQAAKLEVEPQITTDIYTTVPSSLRVFLFTPDISSSTGVTFSSKFESEDELLAHRRQSNPDRGIDMEDFNQKLASLRNLSSKWIESEAKTGKKAKSTFKEEEEEEIEEDTDDEERFDDDEPINGYKMPSSKSSQKTQTKKQPLKKTPAPSSKKSPSSIKKGPPPKKSAPQKKTVPNKKAAPAKSKAASSPKKKPALRSILKPKKAQAKPKTVVNKAVKKSVIGKKSSAKKSSRFY